MEFALAAPDIDTSLQRLLDGFVLELRNPAERRWRHLAVQLWAESLSNPRLKREALGGVSQAVDVLSRMIAQAQSRGSWPKHLDPASAARVMIAILQGISLQRAWDERVDIERFAVALRMMLDPASDKPGRTTGRLSRRQCPPSSRKARGGRRAAWSAVRYRQMHRSEFFPLAKIPGRAEHLSPPTQSRAELQTRRRQWDKTSEVPAVHGASRWWALSKAVKPHFLKPYWRERAPFECRQRRCRNFRRRFQPRGAQSQDGRRPDRRHHQFHGRQLHLYRLSRLDRVRARHARRASRGRCRGGGLRSGREEAAATADHPARARGFGHSPFSVSEQDRSRQQAHPRDARDPAAGVARAAGAAADSDLERRSDRRLRRSRAGTRLRLSRTQAFRSRGAGRRQSRPREGSALLDAGKARRPRRRADGAVAGRHPAAARRGVRRSRPRIARRPDLSGAARFGGARERRAAADEGAAA